MPTITKLLLVGIQLPEKFKVKEEILRFERKPFFENALQTSQFEEPAFARNVEFFLVFVK
jgi:hypothetical protein